MKVDITPLPRKGKARRSIRDLVSAVMATEGAGGVVSVAFVDESEMAGLNDRFRGSSEPTDVLSFSSEDDVAAWPDPVDGSRVPDRGEVVVCTAVVERYAQEKDGDPETQLGWALIHGVLHLLGYDHEKDSGEMRARERSLMRELDPKVRAVSTALRG